MLQTRRLILAAAGAALVLRLAFALLYWTDKPLTHDEREYLSLAESLSRGRGFTYSDTGDAGAALSERSESKGTSPRFGRAPGYPAFLAIFRVTSAETSTPTRVKIAQSVLGALAILLIASIARRAAGDRAAVFAAWIAALYPPLVWLPCYVLSEAVYLPLALLCALLLTMAAEMNTRVTQAARSRRHLQRSVTAGVVAGIAALVRPGTLVFLPMAAVWLARLRQPALALAFAVSAALVITPWTLRNLRQYGQFVLIASEGGVTFWTGNHPLARGEGDLAANPELKRAEIHFRAAHPGLTAEQLEPLYYQAALEHVRRDPAWWLTLLARKAFYTFVPIGPSYTLHSTKYLVATVLPYALLGPLAIAGFIVIRRTGHPPASLYLMAASVVLTSLIFFPQERFRLPVIDPLVIVAASAAIDHAGRRHA